MYPRKMETGWSGLGVEAAVCGRPAFLLPLYVRNF